MKNNIFLALHAFYLLRKDFAFADLQLYKDVDVCYY